MRRTWAAGAAIVMCLVLGGMPVAGQDATGAVWVTGTTAPGTFVVEPVGTPVGDVMQNRGAIFTDSMEMSDPRVSGTGTGTWSQDWYTSADAGLAWGTYRLENEGGSWEGTFVSGDGDPAVGSGFLVGQGGYEGLTFYWHQDMVGDQITVVGLIFPGEPPTDFAPLPSSTAK